MRGSAYLKQFQSCLQMKRSQLSQAAATGVCKYHFQDFWNRCLMWSSCLQSLGLLSISLCFNTVQTLARLGGLAAMVEANKTLSLYNKKAVMGLQYITTLSPTRTPCQRDCTPQGRYRCMCHPPCHFTDSCKPIIWYKCVDKATRRRRAQAGVSE